MNTRNHPPNPRSFTIRQGIVLGLALAAGLAAAFSSGCAGTSTASGSSQTTGVIPTLTASTPVLDGEIGEWGDSAVAADGRFLYLRWTTGVADFPPQAAPYTTAIYLDVDGDSSTGRQQTFHTSGPLGVDLEVLLSPGVDGQIGTGVKIFTLDSAGGRAELTHSDADFMFAPTYAAEWYEARLMRALPDTLPLPGVRSAGVAAGVFVTLDPAGVITGFSEEFRAVLPPADPAASARAELIPAKPDGGVRVVSFNVLRSGPSVRPEPFRRLLGALNADVVLLQEWNETATIAPWLESMEGSSAEGSTPWHVRTGPGGVAIASRFELEALGSDRVVIEPVAGNAPRDWPVRFVAARAGTPAGPVTLASVHLKCCGTALSPEDRTRWAEARAINAELRRHAPAGEAVVVGGDINLVGSRPPLDMLRSELDADGSELTLARARVLGDTAYYTWSDAKSQFSPGRLDFVMAGDSRLRVERAFVLDTARLAPAALESAGLRPRDSAEASDHLPVVVDLVRAAS
jgi:endonuclease/exonuclease/phosphatase family metal-dependent hydrolase